MESILNSIKKMLNIGADYKHFDHDIIGHINTALMVLTQIGVGPEKGFSIKSEAETWSDFLTDMSKLEGVKTYIYLRVKPVFDPSTSSVVSSSMDNVAKELEWRLNVNAESIEDEASAALASLMDEEGYSDFDYDDYD